MSTETGISDFYEMGVSDDEQDTQQTEAAYRTAWGLEAPENVTPLCGNRRQSRRTDRPMEDWDGEVKFRCGNEQRAQRAADRSNGPTDEEYDRQNELRHTPEGTDDSPHATIATGLPKRQWKLHVGKDVKAPYADGGWYETDDGDEPTIEETRVRANVEAALQQADVPVAVQERVTAALEGETGRAWSFFGGWSAAACGVLMTFGFEGHARTIAAERDLSASVERLKEHAEERELV